MRLRLRAVVLVLTCATTAAYSQSFVGFTCSVSTPPTTSLNQGGVTELAPDLLITCIHGTTTQSGASVPTVNINIAFNTQVTSRLLDTTNQITEAVLLINDPGSPSSGLTQKLCPADPAINYACDTTVYGVPSGGNALQYTNANIYQGVLTAPNQLVFFNVPVDPPGSNFLPGTTVLTFRTKNIRVNASGLSPQDPVTAYISTSLGFPLANPVTYSGTPTQMTRSVSSTEQIPQCSVSSTPQPVFAVSLTEGYANSFLPQFPITIADASVPVNTGLSTSGFLISGVPRTVASPGVADFGTRIKVTFSGTPAGATLYVPTSINSGIFPPDAPGTPTLTAVLTSTESGPFSAVPATIGGLAPVSNNVAVYEVVSVLPASLTTVETLTVPVSLSSSGSQGSSPIAGTASVQIDFAPSTNTVTATAGPVPAFVMTSPSMSSYTITSCAVSGLSAYSASQSALVNTAFANPLQALVKDSSGNPVNNSAVTFTLPTNGPGALFAGGGNVAVDYSNAQGVATSPQVIANANLGTFNATASSGAMTVNLPLTNIPGVSTLNFSPIPNHNFGDAPFAINASATASPGAITFSIVSGPATVSGSVLTMTGVGTVVVQASQAATASYAAATATQTFLVFTRQAFYGLTCSANASTPLLEHGEGIAETNGDLVLSCTGGTPTPANVAVPTTNIRVDLNTQVTSRLLNGNVTESLLIINDPQTTSQVLCPPNVTNDYVCDTNVSGNGSGGGKGITPSSYSSANIYQGVLTQPNELTFFNVPIDPPGPQVGNAPTPTLFLRVTNVRANASALGVPTIGFSTVSVSASISIDQGIPIYTPLQVVGSTFSGLGNRSTTSQAQFSQCSAQNLQAAFNVSLAEGFSTAFNPRFYASIPAMSIPGFSANTTSDFLISGFPVTTSSPGVADFGSRFKLTFPSTPAGVTLYVPVSLNSTTLNGGVPTQIMQLTSTEAGPFSAVAASSGTGGLLAAVTNNEAIYEVYSEQAISQNTIETYTVPVYLSYSASPGSYPTAGTGSVLVDFAPTSTVTNASAGPIPRFLQTSAPLNTYTITSCAQPTVFIDTPAANATLSGTSTISGWALENNGLVGPNAIASVTIFVDNTQVGTATYGASRTDVCAAFPGRPGCPNVGWTYALNVAALSSGSRTLKAVATDTAGASSFSSVSFNANPILPSVVIESPIANATLSGTVAIGGWAIENRSAPGPAAVSSVTVFVDNAQVGTATYGISRPDVCAAFPSRLGCPNVGWSYSLNVAALSSGSHTLKIVATDTASNSSFNTVTFNANPVVPTVAIESPISNPTLTGIVPIVGWAIENTAVAGPAAVSSVTVFVDNTQVGTATYGISRSDVCGAYPGRLGCPNVGWSYNLNVGALATGLHTLKIVATDTAGNSNFNLANFTAAAPLALPTVYIDAPVANATLSGITPINGWALENTAVVGTAAISSVAVYVDGNAVGTATYGASRSDVCSAFPGRLGCPNVGWSYNLDVSALTTGSHTLKVVATDSANNSSFSQTSFNVNSVQPSIYLESLAPNATLTGTTALTGWAIENRSLVGPNAINSVIVYVDGGEVGTATYGFARPDVCAAFPGRLGCPNVGWSYSLSIASLTAGTHVLKVVATDAVGNSSFTQMNFTANPAPLPSVYIETPAPNATLAGTVQVSGWAIENRDTVGPDAVVSVYVSVDGTPVGGGNALYGIARPDVCSAFPGRLGCPNVGWSVSIDLSLLNPGFHTLTATATDSAHNQGSSQFMFIK